MMLGSGKEGRQAGKIVSIRLNEMKDACLDVRKMLLKYRSFNLSGKDVNVMHPSLLSFYK